MFDGVYEVKYGNTRGRFVIRNGYPVKIDPVLLKAFRFYAKIAKRISK
jgi:hypothetical protein